MRGDVDGGHLVRRKVLTLCSVLMLLLCVATCALWARSYWSQGTYRFRPTVPPPAEVAPLAGRPGEWRYQWGASYGGGAFQLCRLHAGAGEVMPVGFGGDDGPHDFSAGGMFPAATDVRVLRFRYFDSPRRYSTTGNSQSWTFGFRYLTVPGWFPALLLGVPPAVYLLRRRAARRRARAGQCRACGYDLRATPDQCPECGTPAAGEVTVKGLRSE
jgi:hypothetical protein